MGEIDFYRPESVEFRERERETYARIKFDIGILNG